ncbi:vacuolar protein sorting-associated protein 72 homolog [Antedon mediterranea]|uniref:vacuolar protein sorting-associated protein 72 homolog n=1 Tax=Antedon mediterranea TaxID=105859 RepID=UPI003AF7446A
MSLVGGREKRVTAGNRLHRMLAEEADEDDFYKTTYGGFSEEVDDNEYESEASGKESSSDSDISESEDDEPESNDEDEGPKRKKRVVTKAYKEPVKKPSKPKSSSKPHQEKTIVEKKSSQRIDTDASKQSLSSSLRKSSRRSTIQRVTEFKSRIKEREEKAKKMKEQVSKKNAPEVRRLTQEELLKEAKKTEIENIASLKAYQLLEASRKKQKFTKQVYKGPTIKYRSMSMPLVEEIKDSNSTDVVVDKDDNNVKVPPEKKKFSRNFITFSDSKTFDEYFPKKKSRSHGKQICPVTRLPAKYLDPITNIPYATIQAFKVIRETYVPEHTEDLLDYRKAIKSYPQPVKASQ